MAAARTDGASYTRLNCRLSASIKKRAEEAAEILGQSITAFTETALAEKAEQVFSRFGGIQLSERDFQLFVKTITNPPRPTMKLRKAAAAYRKLRARSPESNW
jgi:uncharacterized protein (DUF1778 family)